MGSLFIGSLISFGTFKVKVATSFLHMLIGQYLYENHEYIYFYEIFGGLWLNSVIFTQLTFAYTNSTVETLEKGVKYVQS